MTALKIEQSDRRSDRGTPVTEESVNRVVLVGTLKGAPEARALPSGDTVWALGIKVDRPADHGTKQKSDVLDCAVWAPALARRMAKWREDDLVEVEGALRRRFYRPAGGGLVSRWEVEVSGGRLIRRAGTG